MMQRRSCSTSSLLGSCGRMFTRRSWSHPSSLKSLRGRTRGISMKSSQARPSPSRHRAR
uniref:Uncharacterized protein n=1 Tax=Anguilla anguilla TaxID=7936 RepID=A0A0E9UGW4_ANGAN